MRKPRLTENTIKTLLDEGEATVGQYLYEYKQKWNPKTRMTEEYLYRWTKEGAVEKWLCDVNGLWAYEK